MYMSLMMDEDELISSEETVEIDAAIGPTIAMPASQAGRVSMIAMGMMLSTEPPYSSSEPRSTPLESTPSEVTQIIIRPMMTVPTTMAFLRAFSSLKPMQRTTDCGRQNVSTPTSSHCVTYRPMGICPSENGSIIAGFSAMIVFMMFS